MALETSALLEMPPSQGRRTPTNNERTSSVSYEVQEWMLLLLLMVER